MNFIIFSLQNAKAERAPFLQTLCYAYAYAMLMLCSSKTSVWPRKVVHKSSQTEGFHHFFLTKRDSTTLFGLLGLKIAKKSLQISACFWDRFGNRFGTPKWSQNGSKIDPERLPRRSWSQVAAGSCFLTCFGLVFGPPGTSRIELSPRRRASSC